MLRIIVILVAAAALAGCGTTTYAPQEYPLKEGRIPKFEVNGSVQVRNAQLSTTKTVVSSDKGSTLASSYKDITQAMVEQTKREVDKNGEFFLSSSKVKVIDLKVTYLHATYALHYWTGEIKYTATLGSSRTIEKTSSFGRGNSIQTLNGSLAEAIKDLLNDQRVLAYLAE